MSSGSSNRLDRATFIQRVKAVPVIDGIENFLMLVLVVVLLTLVARAVVALLEIVTKSPLDVSGSIADALYVFVIIELIEILVVYIHEHRIAVDFMIQVAIISGLREVIGHGLTDYSWSELLSISAFLLALGFMVHLGDFRESKREISRRTDATEDGVLRPPEPFTGPLETRNANPTAEDVVDLD